MENKDKLQIKYELNDLEEWWKDAPVFGYDPLKTKKHFGYFSISNYSRPLFYPGHWKDSEPRQLDEKTESFGPAVVAEVKDDHYLLSLWEYGTILPPFGWQLSDVLGVEDISFGEENVRKRLVNELELFLKSKDYSPEKDYSTEFIYNFDKDNHNL